MGIFKIFGYFWLFHLKLFLVILAYFTLAIGGYFVSGCWWLFMVIVLVVIGEYFIGGYWWILVDIGGYWWLLILLY